MSEAAIRLLAANDLPAVLDLALRAGWNQTAEDIAMLLRLAPAGCFGLECEGRIAATTTLLPLDARLAWLGMVLTGEEYRRRGFARLLVRRALDYAAEAGIATVKLDATVMGRPLYLDMGFRDEQPVERWSGLLAQLRAGNQPAPDETPLLRELAPRSEVFRSADAWALVRPGARARYLGPFMAGSPEAARALMACCFRAGEGDLFYWDVLPRNEHAVRLLEDLGFERVRSLIRMVYGPDLAGGEERVYAISGFELG